MSNSPCSSTLLEGQSSCVRNERDTRVLRLLYFVAAVLRVIAHNRFAGVHVCRALILRGRRSCFSFSVTSPRLDSPKHKVGRGTSQASIDIGTVLIFGRRNIGRISCHSIAAVYMNGVHSTMPRWANTDPAGSGAPQLGCSFRLESTIQRWDANTV
jgi:hypothetical protein